MNNKILLSVLALIFQLASHIKIENSRFSKIWALKAAAMVAKKVRQ